MSHAGTAAAYHQANACRQHHQPGRQHLEPAAQPQQQDNILRPIIRIMLKVLFMFAFW